MRIGILGSGLMGSKLGTIFARAGHEVIFSYARTREKLEQLAEDAGANASAGTPAEAARDADAVLLAVHWTRVDEVLKQAGRLSGKVVVTCSLPMSKDDSHLVIGQPVPAPKSWRRRFEKPTWCRHSALYPVSFYFRCSRDAGRGSRQILCIAEMIRERRELPLV